MYVSRIACRGGLDIDLEMGRFISSILSFIGDTRKRSRFTLKSVTEFQSPVS